MKKYKKYGFNYNDKEIIDNPTFENKENWCFEGLIQKRPVFLNNKNKSDIIEDDAYLFRWMYIRKYVKRGGLFRALKFFEEILFLLKYKTIEEFSWNFFYKSVCYFLPLIDLKKIKLGGSVYSVPFYITNKKKILISCNWFYDELKKRNGFITTNGFLNLVLESYDDFKKEDIDGVFFKKKEEWESEGIHNRIFLTSNP